MKKVCFGEKIEEELARRIRVIIYEDMPVSVSVYIIEMSFVVFSVSSLSVGITFRLSATKWSE